MPNRILLTKVVLLKKVNKQPQVTWLFTIPYSFPEKVAHPAQRIHCLCGSAMQLKNGSGGKTPNKKVLPFLTLTSSNK